MNILTPHAEYLIDYSLCVPPTLSHNFSIDPALLLVKAPPFANKFCY